MSKKKNDIPDKVKNANILIYDENNIVYYNGLAISFGQTAINDRMYHLDGSCQDIHLGWVMQTQISDLKCLDNIKLDDTIMKRIAKFNKEQECLRLDEKIKNKKEEIKRLDDLLQDKEQRWQKVRDYIAEIYDLNIDGYICDDYD